MEMILGSANDRQSVPAANEALKMAVHSLEWGLESNSGWGKSPHKRAACCCSIWLNFTQIAASSIQTQYTNLPIRLRSEIS
jgi:hypothetical protein